MLAWLAHLDAALIDGILKGSALIVFLVISQGIIWLLKFRLRRKYAYDTKDLANMDEVQAVSLSYFKRQQALDIARALLLLACILLGVLFYNIQAFSFLALALGAVVLNQKENINSIIAYFYILSNYNVGDDITIMGSLGEVVLVTLFHTILAGKDENGEYNGKRVSVPNYQFLLNTIERQELRVDAYRRVTVEIPYARATFGMSFDDFLGKLKPFLDELLPKRNLARVGRYRGFAGEQYKINFRYNDGGALIVHVSYISRPKMGIERKEAILTFVEGLKSGV